jgi:hypothetical protein
VSRPALGPLDRLATAASGGRVLVMTSRFGRSSVRDAAYRQRLLRHLDRAKVRPIHAKAVGAATVQGR